MIEKTLSKKNLIAYIVIILLHIISMIYWCSAKQNYYVDELFSMGYASCFTGEGDTARYFTTSDDWRDETWMTNSDLKRHMTVSDTEKITKLPLHAALAKLLTSNNYYGLLNLVYSVSNVEQISKWPGLVFNIFIFVLIDCLLIILFRRLNVNEYIGYCGVLLFCMSSYFIGLAAYIRFYSLITLYILAFLILLHIAWTSDSIKIVALSETGAFAFAYLTMVNTQLSAVYIAAMLGLLALGFIFSKSFIKLIPFCCGGLLTAVVVAVNTRYVNILLKLLGISSTNDKTVSELTSLDAGASGKIMTSPVWDKVENNMVTQIRLSSVWTVAEYMLGWFREFLTKNLLGGTVISVFWVVFFAVLILITAFSEKCRPYRRRIIGSIVWVCTAIVIFFLIRAIGLEMVLVPLFLIITFILRKELIGMLRLTVSNKNDAFAFMLLCSLGMYTLFAGIAYLNATRYVIFAVIPIFILIVLYINRAFNILNNTTGKVVAVIFAVLVLANCIYPFASRNVEYIYESDIPFCNSIHEYLETDTVLLCKKNTYNKDRHAFDAVGMLPDDTKIYAATSKDAREWKTELPECFTLWVKCGELDDLTVQSLKALGYQINLIGEDHVSDAYLIKKP